MARLINDGAHPERIHHDLMTLAITALCKDGAYVRTDRRSTTKTVSGTSSYQDSLNKILKSSDGRLIVYNHNIPPNKDTTSHWAGLSFSDAKAEVDALFKDALARQLAVKGEEFSGTYDEATL